MLANDSNAMLAMMQAHASTRNYQDKPVDSDVLNQIIEAAQHGPTSINGQQVSLVITQDPTSRRKIAEIAGGQPWIAQAPVFITVLIDFYKTSIAMQQQHQTQVIHQSVEGFAVGAVDAGITLGNLMTAARAAGLGVVPIGGIRRDPRAMIDLLKLPKLTFPIVGLTLGYTDHPGSPKPRLPIATFAHAEHYETETLPMNIQAYDAELLAHWRQVQRSEGESWSASVASFYRSIYFPRVAEVAREQGFSFDR